MDVLRGNRVIWISAGALLVLQCVFVYVPVMHDWFASAPIGAAEWGKCLALSVVVFLAVEAVKWLGRRQHRTTGH